MAAHKRKPPRRPRVRPLKRSGGLLMGMRTGFRKVTGTAHSTKTAKTTSGVRRGILIAVGVVLVVALVWGLSQR